MRADYSATQVVNDRPRPRVLLYAADPDQFDWVAARAATLRRIQSLDEVDLGEWDLIVSDKALLTHIMGQRPRKSIPRSLYSFVVEDLAKTGDHLIDGKENQWGRLDGPELKWVTKVPGHLVKRVQNLPEVLQDLVQKSLVPAVEKRRYQEGIIATTPLEELVPTVTDVRPFLVGPRELMLGASYRREGGSRHWVIPSDIETPEEWLDCAINEWHAETPKTFPTGAAWQTTPAWMTREELRANDSLIEAREQLRTQVEALEAAVAEAEVAVASLRSGGDLGQRRLVTAQDDDLQSEVLSALQRLGYEVRDMDLEWEPRARREDYRLTDPDDADWYCLADATGTTNGAKLGKFTALQAHASKYLLEERPKEAPTLWMVVNHLLNRDPAVRGPLFTEADAEVIADAGGLAIDSAALFLLVREVTESPEKLPAVRAWLRSSLGQLTLAQAKTWIADNQSDD